MSSPTITETVSPQSGDQRLPVESFQTWNIRARVREWYSGLLSIEVYTLIAIGVFVGFFGLLKLALRDYQPTPCACPCDQDGGAP